MGTPFLEFEPSKLFVMFMETNSWKGVLQLSETPKYDT